MTGKEGIYSFIKWNLGMVLLCWVLLVPVSSTIEFLVCPPFFYDPREWSSVHTTILNETQRPLQWSPNGDQIVVSSTSGDIYLVQADGSDFRLIHRGSGWKSYHHSLDISPDGASVVYATSRHCMSGRKFLSFYLGNNFEIETSLLDGSVRRRLTHNSDQDTFPAWSPDGMQVVFVKKGSEEPGIYAIDPNDAEERLIVPGRVTSFLSITGGPTWSPDGGTIAFGGWAYRQIPEGEQLRGPDPTRGILYTVEADGSGLRQLFVDSKKSIYVADVRPIAWSPDGQRIAFSLTAFRDGGTDSRGWDTKLYTVGQDGDGLREIPHTGGLVSGGVKNLEWSPDGSQILLAALGVYLIDMDGPGIHQISDGSGYAAWSPDGSRIVLLREAPNAILESMNKDGSGVQVLVRINEDGRLVVGNQG